MTLSKTTEYALRVLSFMSLNPEKMYSSYYLHRHLKIPKKYLQRLLTDLSKSGLIRSNRGRNGGYVFAKKIDSIYISDIIDAVEGFSHEPGCFLGFKKCALENPCAMHDFWASTQKSLIHTLSSTRLVDLIKN
jgi:Rrf2 family protein